jgi:hypothetical protein
MKKLMLGATTASVMTSNWSANTKPQRQQTASPQGLRSGYL